MGRKAGISLVDVVEVAAAIADRDGYESATLTAVASELGIKTPSLYNHVTGLPGLRRLVAIHGAQLLLEEFSKAVEGRAGSDALREIAQVDVKFARVHPGLYRSFLPAPAPGEDDELYDALAAPVLLVAGVLLDMGIPQSEALHLIRAFRALLHGFIELEASGGFGMPIGIDTSFDTAVELMISGIEESVPPAQPSTGAIV